MQVQGALCQRWLKEQGKGDQKQFLHEEEQYQGGKWLCEHPEFWNYLYYFRTNKSISFEQAIHILQKCNQKGSLPLPEEFPLVDVRIEELDQIKKHEPADVVQYKKKLISPYIHPTSRAQLEVELARRRKSRNPA